MPIETRIDTEANLITHEIMGEFDLDGFKVGYDSLLAHPDFSQDMNVLWDLREGDVSSFSYDDLMNVTRYIENRVEGEASVHKVAIVASSNLGFGISRMYEMLSEELPIILRVFRDIEEASKWLGER